jgi:two-component system, cell cycle response regulator DivK
MPGEPILIVDDTPVNLKLTRILLVNEGYKVLTAGSAEEALELLRSYHPRLILADIQLPGMDGLEFTRQVKQNENTRDIVVVALTAFAMKGDELRAAEAGCDGYITKPIDTRSLGQRLRTYLDRASEVEVPAASLESVSVPVEEVQALRRRFLEEGQTSSRQWLLDLDSDFNANEAERKAHQWIGAAGLLGYSAIARLARELEGILHERPVDAGQTRDALTNLVLAFSTPREARDAPVPDSIVQSLAGKRVALVEVSSGDRERLCVALERAKAIPVFLMAAEVPGGDAVQSCDVVVVDIRPPDRGTAWLAGIESLAARKPIVFVGEREHILDLDPSAHRLASEYLLDVWEPDEALVRLSLSLSHPVTSVPPQARPAATGVPVRARVLIADDDPTVLALVKAALQNFGMDCYTASDGRSALDMLRRQQLHAAVLDVNMPELDGYAVLSGVRGENLPVKVLLLTARQQENDVIRGFALGADDYMVKPFSPMELVARLKRLLGR